VKERQAKDKRGQPTESIDATTPKESEPSRGDNCLRLAYPASLTTMTKIGLKRIYFMSVRSKKILETSFNHIIQK
tara:strand:- start:172 stop:396 length:225 start_codon:yes stop_codon:yes gene_type:complete